MNTSIIHERLSGKLKRVLTRIKRMFRLSLRFKAKSHTNIARVRKDIHEAGPMCWEGTKQRRSGKRKDPHQIVVPCTRRIRKRILKNLRATSVSRVSPTRARIACEILNELKKNGSLVNFQPHSILVRKDSDIEVNESILKVAGKAVEANDFVPGMLGQIQADSPDIRQPFHPAIGTDTIRLPVAS